MKTLTYLIVVAALAFSVSYSAAYYNWKLKFEWENCPYKRMLKYDHEGEKVWAEHKMRIAGMFEDIYIQWYDHGERMKKQGNQEQYQKALEEQQKILDRTIPKISMAQIILNPYYNYDFFLEYYKLQPRSI